MTYPYECEVVWLDGTKLRGLVYGDGTIKLTKGKEKKSDGTKKRGNR